MIRFFRAAALALLLVPSAGTAQDYDAGLAAEQTGDFATALREWMPLAQQGDARAQVNLAVLYAQGRGVPQDAAEALKWYRLAAEQGNADAQINLGIMYRNGKGVSQDYVEAIKWFRLAAEQGNANAQTFLSFMYANGHGVPQDYVTAHMWANLSAATGNTIARDLVAPYLTPADLSEAQRRARTCLVSSYQDCD